MLGSGVRLYLAPVALLAVLPQERVKHLAIWGFGDLAGIQTNPSLLFVLVDVMRAFVHIVSHPARSSPGLLCHIQKCVDVLREEMNGTMLEIPNLVHVTNDVP